MIIQFMNDIVKSYEIYNGSHDLEHKYRVREQSHAFLKIGGNFYRANEIWRIRARKCRSDPDEETLMTRNFALLKYEPKKFLTVSPGQENRHASRSLKNKKNGPAGATGQTRGRDGP
ncbi:MAG: vancomycin resistance protein [Verrucomicrobiales bacterium]|nr:vancomycin resistance protein [Verrucomicrobiales bacterium]